MIEIWLECAKFQTTSQWLADQVRTIIKEGWFSDSELLEINQKTQNQNYNTEPDISSGVEQKQSKEKELQTPANKNTTRPNDTLPSNQEETLSQEQKINLENIKGIISSEKTILPSLRNIEWKTLKIETDKINHVLPYIPTNNITELNELIYAGAKLVCENIAIPLKSTKKQSKPGWEIQLETQIKKIRKQARMIKKKERRWNKWGEKGTGNTRKNNSTTWGNKSESAGQRRKIKEISTKGKTTKENSINDWEGVTQKHTNNRMQKKPNDFGQKYRNQKNLTKMLNG